MQFDLPKAFLPEFPPAILLQSRPELGDVSRGEVVSINNFHRLFKDILTPVQLDGLRLLVTPFPQEEFNPRDGLGQAVACAAAVRSGLWWRVFTGDCPPLGGEVS